VDPPVPHCHRQCLPSLLKTPAHGSEFGNTGGAASKTVFAQGSSKKGEIRTFAQFAIARGKPMKKE
jgi:hypothetical protein